MLSPIYPIFFFCSNGNSSLKLNSKVTTVCESLFLVRKAKQTFSSSRKQSTEQMVSLLDTSTTFCRTVKSVLQMRMVPRVKAAQWWLSIGQMAFTALSLCLISSLRSACLCSYRQQRIMAPSRLQTSTLSNSPSRKGQRYSMLSNPSTATTLTTSREARSSSTRKGWFSPTKMYCLLDSMAVILMSLWLRPNSMAISRKHRSCSICLCGRLQAQSRQLEQQKSVSCVKCRHCGLYQLGEKVQIISIIEQPEAQSQAGGDKQTIALFDAVKIKAMRNSDYHRKERERSRSRSPRDRDDSRSTDRQAQQPKFKLEQTRTLLLEGVGDAAGQAERTFTDLSISIGTSVPDEVQIQGDKLFLRYPSVEAAMSVMEHVKGEVQLGGRKLRVQYFPVRKVDVNVAYDWYCEKCDYKNFARRNRCYRCEGEKTATCRLSYSTQPALRPLREETPQNCSLMLRGPVITEVEEGTLLEIFEGFAPVRDIRQIKNKLTGAFKDFAFIEFFTPEETAAAFREANEPDFKINGQKVTVMYSRNKADDDFVKPLPYESVRRERRGRERTPQEDNYYHRQRQREIEEEKARPSITMDQLREKREQELRKNQPAPKEMSEEQARRRQAEQLAKQWEREMKVQATLFVCPACSRKFQSLEQMRTHERMSQLHKFQMARLQGAALAL